MLVLAGISLPSFSFSFDVEAGVILGSQKESYSVGDSDYNDKSARLGLSLSNFNFFYGDGIGFFESLDFELLRWNLGKSSAENTYPFFAFKLLVGPAYKISLNEKSALQFGAGFHYLAQFYDGDDDCKYYDNDLGIGLVFSYLYNLNHRFAVSFGADAFFDFYNCKSYTYEMTNYKIDTDGYKSFGVEPRIAFVVKF